MDQDVVRLFLVLEDNSWTWTPTMPRWKARDAMRDFGEAGEKWDDLHVRRALIVDTGAPT